MKIKQIERILKDRKVIYTVQTFGGQWIGDGSAFYPIRNMPDLTKENFYTMFDINDDQKSKWHYIETSRLPIEEGFSNDTPLTRSKMSLRWRGDAYEALISQAGLTFIKSKYLAPYSDIKDGYELYRRKCAGLDVIAVKAGLICIGLIYPWIPNEEFLKDFFEFRKYRVTDEGNPDTFEEEAEQMTLGGVEDAL